MTDPQISFVDALKDADQAFARVRPSARLDERVARSLHRPSWGVKMPLVFGTAAVAMAWALQLQIDVAPTASAPTISDPCVPEDSDIMRISAGCSFSVSNPVMMVRTKTATELKKIDRGLMLLSGSAEFHVDRVEEGERVVVAVSDGRIEVVGTRFTVNASARGGGVRLMEGAIDFVAANDRVTRLKPGQRLVWGSTTVGARLESIEPSPPQIETEPVEADLAEVTEKAPRLKKAVSKRSSASISKTRDLRTDTLSPEAVDSAVRQVIRARMAGQYAAALAVIDRLLRQEVDATTAEVLSFERGTLLSLSKDSKNACAHWRAHQDRFGAGRYGAAVETALSACEEAFEPAQ